MLFGHGNIYTWESLISYKRWRGLNLAEKGQQNAFLFYFFGMLLKGDLPTLQGAAFSVSSFSFSTLLGIAFGTASASSLMNLNGVFT